MSGLDLTTKVKVLTLATKQTVLRVQSRGMQGPAGPQGPTGAMGPQGETGAAGVAGKDGTNGADGASAYEVAVNNGFVGTEGEWLASLQGPAGPAGVDGSDASVTTENIEAALGYTPADQGDVDKLRQYPPLPASGPATVYGHPFLGNLMGTRVLLTAVNSRIYYAIGYVAEPTRVADPRVNVQTGQAGATARAGICVWDPVAGAPGALLMDWGTADCGTSGFKTFSNGAAYVDLVPGQCYAIIFVSGGGAAVPFYYQSLSPVGVRALVEGVTVSNIVSFWSSTNGAAQHAGGFNDPPNVLADMNIEASVNQTGWRTLVYFGIVEPSP